MFDRLRQSQPGFRSKVVPVAGDIRQQFLGLSDADHNQLHKNVSVAIHSAATLSFVEPLRSVNALSASSFVISLFRSLSL